MDDELWYDSSSNRACVASYGGAVHLNCHLFVGYVARDGTVVHALGPTLETFMVFDDDDYSTNVCNAIQYAQARNALPGVLLNATSLQPLSFFVVALAGTSFKSLRGGNNVVPEGHVLAVNIWNPRHYEFVALSRVGTAESHILHSALDAAQKLYSCFDPEGEQYILEHTLPGLDQTSTLATHIGHLLFRPQV